MTRAKRTWPWVSAALALGLGACSDGPRSVSEDPPASTGLDSSGGDADGSDTVVEMTKLDVGAGNETGGPGELNCERIDFLFVIDNSSSMQREQERLVESVPAFTETILGALPNISDIRVGVVDTDAFPGLGAEDPLQGCPDDGTYDCDSCDYTLGALLTKPLSALDPDATCDFSTGAPFMDARAPSFPEEFACVANVGTEGNQVEQQAGALVQAVSPAMLDGGCNDGFLRDDALLIVLIITDEADDHAAAPAPQGGSVGDPPAWLDALVEAKGGLATNIVALGLTGGWPAFTNCGILDPNGMGAEPSPRLVELIESFDVNFVGSVCLDSYDEFFDDVLSQVAAGCAQFVPG